jgi:hypothetical protein
LFGFRQRQILENVSQIILELQPFGLSALDQTEKVAAATAPYGLPANNQFFLPKTKGRMAIRVQVPEMASLQWVSFAPT